MLLGQRNERAVSRVHRRTLRVFHIQQLEDAYRLLRDGYSERLVRDTLRIDAALMESTLKAALEEALWERGYFSSFD